VIKKSKLVSSIPWKWSIIFARRYLVNHTEVSDSIIQDNNQLPRVGALIKVEIAKWLVETIDSVSTLLFFLLRVIPEKSVSNLLRGALPQLQQWPSSDFILVDGTKVYFDQCHQNLRYLAGILADDRIPFEIKERVAKESFAELFKLNTNSKKVAFVTCMVVS